MTTNTPKKGLHIGLWVAQVLLGAAFGMAGIMKLGTPAEEMIANGMAWADRVPAGLILFIGAAELAGAIGLIVPSATRILPSLTPLAAAALTLVMVLAAGEHVMAGEGAHIAPNFVLGGLALFVAWGRHKAAPITARDPAARTASPQR